MATAEALAPKIDRRAQFMARVEQHLESLPAHERLPFLRTQRATWIARSERFAEAVDRGCYDDMPDTPDAWDYALVIADLNTLLAREKHNAKVPA